MGRRELAAFAPRTELAARRSEFNRKELERLGFTETAVLPVVPDFSHLEEPPDPVIAAPLDDDWTNILFVGRIIPNKKIEDLIRFYAAYQRTLRPPVAPRCSSARRPASTGTSACCTTWCGG